MCLEERVHLVDAVGFVFSALTILFVPVRAVRADEIMADITAAILELLVIHAVVGLDVVPDRGSYTTAGKVVLPLVKGAVIFVCCVFIFLPFTIFWSQ